MKKEIPTSATYRTIIPLFIVSLVGIASACSGSKDSEKITPEMGRVNPNEVRIAATVTSIDTARAERADDPCAAHPCFATVVVDSVLEYGSGFPRPLSEGEEVIARFAFTLSPTEVAMPELAEPYPGLEEGSSFWADLRAHPRLGGETPTFVIYDYYVQ